MKKDLILNKIDHLSVTLGEKMPTFKTLCEKLYTHVKNATTYDAASYFLVEMSKFDQHEQVQSDIEEIQNKLNENAVELFYEKTVSELGNSNSSLDGLAYRKLRHLDKSNLVNELNKAEITDLSFNSKVKKLLQVVEYTQAENDTSKQDTAINESFRDNNTYERIANMIKSIKESIDITSYPRFHGFINRNYKAMRSHNPITVLENVVQGVEKMQKNKEIPKKHSILTFIEESKDILDNNKNTLKLIKGIQVLENNKNAPIYRSGINTMKSLVKKGEKFISENLVDSLKDLTWIPTIKSIVNQRVNEVRQQRIAESNQDVGKYKVQSETVLPIVHENDSIYTQIGKSYYTHNDNGLVPVDENNISTESIDKLNYLSNLKQHFIFESEGDNTNIKYKPRSNFSIVSEDNSDTSMYLNDEQVVGEGVDTTIDFISEGKDDIKNYLKYLSEHGISEFVATDRVVTYNDGYQSHFIVESDGDVFKDGEQVNNVRKLVKNVHENYGYDLRHFLSSHMPNNFKFNLEIDRKLDEAETAVEFYQSQIKKIDNSGVNIDNNPQLFEARKSLRKQLVEANNKLTELKNAKEKAVNEGWDLLFEEKDLVSENKDKTYDSKEDAVKYAFNYAKKYDEKALPDKDLEKAIDKIKDKFKKSMKGSKIKKYIDKYVQTNESVNEGKLQRPSKDELLSKAKPGAKISIDTSGNGDNVIKTVKSVDGDIIDFKEKGTLDANDYDYVNYISESESVNEEEYVSHDPDTAKIIKKFKSHRAAKRWMNKKAKTTDDDLIIRPYKDWKLTFGDTIFNGEDVYVNESFSKSDIKKLKDVVSSGKDLVSLRDPIKNAGFKNVDFSFQPVPHFSIKKGSKTFYILNKKYADDYDWVVGNIAGGVSESLNEALNESVNESKDSEGYVVVAMHKKGGGFVVTEPTTKKKAEKYVKDFPDTGESIIEQKVVSVSDAKKIKKLVGKEYLSESVTEKIKVINESDDIDMNEEDIDSDKEFKEYAKKLLKKAFGDEFDEKKADDTADGLIKKYDGDYGAMVGALQSSLD